MTPEKQLYFWYCKKNNRWYSLDEVITLQQNKKQIRLINSIPVWSKRKVKCSCGLETTNGYFKKHLQTNKHKKLIEKQK